MLGFNTRKPRASARIALGVTALLASTMLTAQAAHAEDAHWQFRSSSYAFFPDLSSRAALPAGTSQIDIDAGDLIDHTDASYMHLLEGQHGRFGAFVDFMYFKVGNSVTDSTQLSIGGGTPLPPGVTLDGDLEVKMWVLTLAGNYRLFDTPDTIVDVFGGARMLKLDTDLSYAFTPGFGPFSGPFAAGSAGASQENWDAVVGVKGRNAFGADRRWFATYYADVGAGDSDLTWQAFAGLGRKIGRHYEVTAGWRHLDYEFGDDNRIQDISFDGPIVGATVSW